jgi:hypothetical protein
MKIRRLLLLLPALTRIGGEHGADGRRIPADGVPADGVFLVGIVPTH